MQAAQAGPQRFQGWAQGALATGEVAKGTGPRKGRLQVYPGALGGWERGLHRGWTLQSHSEGQADGGGVWIEPTSPPLSCRPPPPGESGVRVFQVQLADSGTFTCVAVSPAGVADRNFTLQVLGTQRGGHMGPLTLVSENQGP